MRTARPAARPPHSFFELRAHPFDVLPPCLIFLHGDGPADPFVARERRYVFPGCQCFRVRLERLSEISRKVMDDALGDSNRCHRVISRPKGSSLRYEITTRIPGLSLPIREYPESSFRRERKQRAETSQPEPSPDVSPASASNCGIEARFNVHGRITAELPAARPELDSSSP